MRSTWCCNFQHFGAEAPIATCLCDIAQRFPPDPTLVRSFLRTEIKPFAEMLDGPITNYSKAKVKGSGYLNRIEFRLNVRNPNPTVAAATGGNIGGHINAAINDWNDHFSVRCFCFIFTDHINFI